MLTERKTHSRLQANKMECTFHSIDLLVIIALMEPALNQVLCSCSQWSNFY